MKLKMPKRSDFHSRDDYETARIATVLANLALKHGATLEEVWAVSDPEFRSWSLNPLRPREGK